MWGRLVTDPDEEFHKIVDGLDFDIPFPETVPDPEPLPPPELAKEADYDDDLSYRIPVRRPLRIPTGARLWAWAAVVAGPILLVLATMSDLWLPGTVILAAAIIFVAAVIYLIAQLPERGPSHPDWPDDGAVL